MDTVVVRRTRLRLYREEACLSTAQLAAACRVSRSVILEVEGGRPPWPRLRAALAEQLGVTESLLFEAGPGP